MAESKIKGELEADGTKPDDLKDTELEADPNPGRFVQSGGGKIYRDGVLVEDFDDDE